MTPLFLPALASAARPIDPLEAERQALRERQLELERARSQFEEEQKLLRGYWRSRHQDEWDRLRQEATRQADALARQRHSIQEKQTELELRRREQEQLAQEFTLARRSWHEQEVSQKRTLREAEEKLAAERKQLEQDKQEFRQAKLDGERLRTARGSELEGLEKRIVGYRGLLGQLRDEVSGLEQRLLAAEPIGGMVAEHEPSLTEGLLGELANVLDELFTEHLRLSDCRDEMLAMREAWALEWERASQALAEQDAELQDEAEALRQRQQNLRKLAATVARQLEELALKQKAARAKEEELLKRQTALRCEQGRALAEARAKSVAAKSRQRQADRLIAELRKEELKRLVRFETAERTLAASQRALFDRHEQLDMRETWLDQREKDLLARGWVLGHAEQQLIHRDPHPKAAEAELERRLEVFMKLAERGEQRDLDRADALDEALRDLEAFRQRLLAARAELDDKRVQLQLLRLTAVQEREHIDAERTGWKSALRQLKQERQRLREQSRDLAEQVERLTLAMMEPRPPELTLARAA